MTAAVTGRRATRRALPAVPGWWADAAGSAAVLSLLVVTALWVADRGVQQLFGGRADAASPRSAGSPACSPPTCCSSRCC